MAFISELDVINDMLASLGEAPLNSIEEDHPMVASGVRQLRMASYREQAKGWWFNKELVTLQADPVTSEVLVPADCISLDPIDPNQHLVQRGRKLYDPRNGTFKFSASIPCAMTRYIDFTDLPPSAAVYISASAVLMFQKSYDADATKTRQLMQDLQQAYMALNAEHIRNMNVNLLNRPSTLALMGGLGFSPQLGGLQII